MGGTSFQFDGLVRFSGVFFWDIKILRFFKAGVRENEAIIIHRINSFEKSERRKKYCKIFNIYLRSGESGDNTVSLSDSSIISTEFCLR